MVILGLFTGVGTILHQLYLASDLDLLLAAPVSLRDLFLLKLAEAWFATGIGGVLGLAVLVGYGRALEMPPPFWPLALLVIGAVTLVPTALAMVVVMLAMRIMPTKRVEGIVALLGGLLAAVMWLLFQTVNVGGRRNPAWQPGSESLRDLEQMAVQWGDAVGWTPVAWAVDALTAVGEGKWPALTLDLALLGGATVGLVGIAYLIFRQSFYLGWGGLREVAPRGQKVRGRGGLLPGLLRPLPSPVRAIVLKDWRVLPRDLRVLGGLIMPIAMLAFFGFSALRGGPGDLPAPAGFWLGMLPVALIPFMLGGNLSSRAFGMEGRGFALLRASPLKVGQIFIAKLVASYLPMLALTWAVALLLGVWLGGSLAQIAATLGMSAWLAAGVVAAYVGGGAMSTNFEADNPQTSVGCLGQLVSFVAGSLFLLANVGLFAWLVLGSSGILPPGLPGGEAVGLALGAGVVVSVAGIAGLARLGVKTLEGWEGN